MVKKQHGSPLRNLRRVRTISQVQMAGLLRISQQTYCKYERGQITPSSDMQALIAAVLGSTPRELFPVDPPAEPVDSEAVAS